MWAVAVYDLDLSLEEFEELTPGMFQALCKRRNVAIKYERFANAQTAAAVYNVNRHSDEAPIVRPFDFVMDDEQAKERERVLAVRRYIRDSVKQVPVDCPRSKFLETRRKVIHTLVGQGHAEAEAIFNELWPSLKPKEDEQ